MSLKLKFYLVVFLVLFLPLSGRCKDSLTLQELYPGMSYGIFRMGKLVDMKDGICSISGKKIGKKFVDTLYKIVPVHLKEKMKQNIFFFVEKQAVKELILINVKKEGIAKEGMTERDIIHKYILKITEGIKVKDREIDEFYRLNKDRLGKLALKDIREGIRGFLLKEKKNRAIQDRILELAKNAKIEINKRWASEQYNILKSSSLDGARMSGRATIVEFESYNCKDCTKMKDILKQIGKKYKELNFVYMNVKEDPIVAARFGIRYVPIQIYFNKNGYEIYRHEGLNDAKQIEKILKILNMVKGE